MKTTEPRQPLLSDHGDMRPVTADTSAPADRHSIVQLSPDHPGFRDEEYRARRNRIAQLALDYRAGEPVPEAPYTEEEHGVWRAIWAALGPAHESHACAEYLDCVRRLELPRDRIRRCAKSPRRSKLAAGSVWSP